MGIEKIEIIFYLFILFRNLRAPYMACSLVTNTGGYLSVSKGPVGLKSAYIQYSVLY